MKLVFYSSGDAEDNLEIDKIMLRDLAKSDPQITYIPSESNGSDRYFQAFVRQYKKLKVKKFMHMPIDIPILTPVLEQAFKSDIIHLSGGNTYYFLKHLRKNKLLNRLKLFVKKGGILTGTSAGAIIMTPNIGTASFPIFDCDENDVLMKNLKSMSLVDFEFFPHYRYSKRYDQALINHSQQSIRPIIACPDGAGIIINNKISIACGKLSCFYQGKKIPFKN
jgi:dipeptidase E